MFSSDRKISPEILPSCSPGIFRQRSFSSIPTSMTVPATTTRTAQVSVAPVTQCDRVPAPSQTSDRLFSRSRVLSRGSRKQKHSRFGTALANKMASASSTTAVCWPNTKDDYDLKEVIGEYHPHMWVQLIPTGPSPQSSSSKILASRQLNGRPAGLWSGLVPRSLSASVTFSPPEDIVIT